MGGLKDLFVPKQPCRPFMAVPNAGIAAGVVEWEYAPGDPYPAVDQFIGDGRFQYFPTGSNAVPEAGQWGNSMREFFPDQIIGDPRMIARPDMEPPAWGNYLYGTYQAFDDGLPTSTAATFDPVQPGDYFDYIDEPDDSQMYYITPSGGGG